MKPRYGMMLLALMMLFTSSCQDDETQEVQEKQTPPKVSTGTATNVAKNSATLDGTVTDDGHSPVTARGIVWSTTANPNTDGNKSVNGTGTGNFTGELTGLTANTVYFARTYATNAEGTSYGDPVSFTTNDLPQVTAATATSVGTITATVSGTVSFDGNTPVTNRGFIWSANPNPTFADFMVSTGSGTGTFSATLTSLMENTTYYVRAFATNSQGTTFSADLKITTGETPTVNTGEPYDVTTVTAIVEGEASVSNVINTVIIEYGICWSKTTAPTVADQTLPMGSGQGGFTAYLDGLDPETLYFARAYATTSAGTTYGNEVKINTGSMDVNLKAHFTFDNTFADLTGNNSVLSSGTSATFIADRKNANNSAVSFDGTTESYAIGNVNLGNSDAITVSFWFKQVTGETTYLVYAQRFQFYVVLPDAYFVINGKTAAGYAQKNKLTAENFVNTWHHFAGVYTGSTMSLYIDGELASSSAFTLSDVFGNDNYTFGGSSGINYYKYVLDDVKMYNRALSASEVSYIFKH